MLTAALIALLFLARQLAGLPFVPFDVFDWTARALPGDVITFGIDSMVAIIRGLDLGPTSAVAKIAEQIMAIGGLFVTGIIAGALLFAVLRRVPKTRWYVAGLLLGALVAVPVLLISVTINRSAPAGPLVGAIWILLAFGLWGLALAWVYRRLSDEQAGIAGGGGAEMDRRLFMIRLVGATATMTLIGAGAGAAVARTRAGRRAAARGEAWSATHALPNAGAEIAPVRGTRPEFTTVPEHYRIDINTRPPVIDEENWRLRVSGLVESPRELTLAQLRAYAPMHQLITLECISNPVAGDLISTQRWTGVSMQRLLPDLDLSPAATHLLIRSADGFYETVALDTIRADERVMLAYDWDGLPLTSGHGFPLRIYIPNLYGMKQPKWIESIEALDHWEPGYWVERGWDRDARIKTTSVIDTVSSNMMIGQGQDAGRIPIGGIAFAGARGISSVEIRVDNGPWEPARLREPLSDRTWVIWRYDWPFSEGSHTFTARCRDGDGTPQVAAMTPVRPDGATGLHSRTVML